MNAPVSLSDGKILLMAGPESFAAGYVRRSLDRLGVIAVATEPGSAAAAAYIGSPEGRSVRACLIADLDPAVAADLAEREPEVPMLFIGEAATRDLPASCRILKRPFASYQVVELLGEMAAAAPWPRRPSLRLVHSETAVTARISGT